MSHKSWLLSLLLIMIGVGGIASGVNFYVDPLIKIRSANWGPYFSSEREYKDRQAMHYSHDSILIGSSRVAHIDPDVLVSDYKFFNASLAGGLPEEYYFYLKKHTFGKKMVIIGIDFFTFNETFKPYLDLVYGNDSRFLDQLYYIISFSTLQYSIRAAYMHFRGKLPSIHPNGQRNLEEAKARESQFIRLNEKLENDAEKLLFNYQNFKFSKKRVNILKEIRKLADQRGFYLSVFLNPIVERRMKLIRANNDIFGHLEITRMILREIFGKNFIDYSESVYSREECFYKHDHEHYFPQCGQDMIQEILNLKK